MHNLDIIHLSQLQTFAIAMLILFVGSQLSSRIYFLQKYNLPEPVIGGLIFSVFSCYLYVNNHISFDFELTSMKNSMMLAFFTTVGLNAKAALLKKGGPKVLLFLLVATVFLIVQDAVGVSLATLLGLDPRVGLLAGSITLSGGHGTGAVYARVFPEIQGAMEIAMACATFGLILGGIIGGPIAEKIISKHKLAPDNKIRDPFGSMKDHGMDEPESVTAGNMFQILLMISLCILCADYIEKFFNLHDIKLPSFIAALFCGILISNTSEFSKSYKLPQQTIDLIGVLSLYIFLTLALMELKIWELLDLAGPLFIIVLIQTVILALYASFVTFRVMGRDYESAVMASGQMGFGLGATPTAVANMEKIVMRYGAAPQAFLTVPLVGAFFIDVANAGVIQMFIYLLG